MLGGLRLLQGSIAAFSTAIEHFRMQDRRDNAYLLVTAVRKILPYWQGADQVKHAYVELGSQLTYPELCRPAVRCPPAPLASIFMSDFSASVQPN